MLLAVDVGNTTAKFAIFEGDRPSHLWRLHTDVARTTDEYCGLLGALFAQSGVHAADVEGVVIASVVPNATPAVVRWVTQALKIEPLLVSSDMDLGLSIDYKPASDVGADRLVDAAAAVAKHGAPVIVIDFGTATTFNAIAAPELPDGLPIYKGGAICPGIGLSLDAFFARAAKLSAAADRVRNRLIRPERAIGNNTIGALESGIVFGYAAQVTGMVARFREELSAPDCPVIATGGDAAELIAHESACITAVEPDLTLEGLRIVYDRSRGYGLHRTNVE
jgi:type III pantothenate kinase